MGPEEPAQQYESGEGDEAANHPAQNITLLLARWMGKSPAQPTAHKPAEKTPESEAKQPDGGMSQQESGVVFHDGRGHADSDES